MDVRTHLHPERIPIAPSTQRPAVILPQLQQGIEDCAKTCTVKSKSRSASSRPEEAYQLANDRSWRKAAVRAQTAALDLLEIGEIAEFLFKSGVTSL